jgi:hypothetical protein
MATKLRIYQDYQQKWRAMVMSTPPKFYYFKNQAKIRVLANLMINNNVPEIVKQIPTIFDDIHGDPNVVDNELFRQCDQLIWQQDEPFPPNATDPIALEFPRVGEYLLHRA